VALFNIRLPEHLKKLAKTAGIFVAILLVFIILNQIPVAAKATQRVQIIFTSIGSGFSNIYKSITSNKSEIQEERDYFQQMASELAIDTAYISQLEKDIQELKILIAYQDSIPYKSTSSKVIARSGEGEHTFLVNKGIVDGMREGLAVVIEDGHLIGIIQEARKHSSIVRKLQSPESKIPVSILGTEGTSGLVNGQDGFLLNMGFIPQEIDIQEFNIVITSGLDGILPNNLLIGVVESISQEETASFKEALIQPIYDIDQYTNVLILDPLSDV
jgi:rod shape-determining protein MreC